VIMTEAIEEAINFHEQESDHLMANGHDGK
jgi:hypothetical protein